MNAAMYMQMAGRFSQLGKTREAVGAYQRVLREEPNNALAHDRLGQLLLRIGKYPDALGHLKRAYSITPGSGEIAARISQACQHCGDLEEARSWLHRALMEHPEGAVRYLVAMAHIKRYDEDDKDIPVMEDLFAKAEPGSLDKMSLGFALGRISDQIGQYEKAFAYLREANRIASSIHRYSFEQQDRDYAQIVKTFNEAFIRNFEGASVDSNRAIFVTGMPRSGSTLVEQIISSHSRVFGGGEFERLHELVQQAQHEHQLRFPAGFAVAPHSLFHDIATRYTQTISEFAPNSDFVTDKNLGTVIFTGLIKTIFPRARIIHVQRDLRDVGLSCYQNYFGENQAYSYDLHSIGRYAVAREQLMEHWKTMFSNDIFSVPYESLVSDTPTWTRRMLKFCNLDFEPECIDFHLNNRVVSTISLEQVRQPMYKTSIGRWRHYAEQLVPLVDAIDHYTALGPRFLQ